MRSEPAIDKAALGRAIGEAYGLPAERLDFVPAGEYATCFVVGGEGGGSERHFIKIWPPPLPTYVSSEATLAMLRLTRLMHERGAFTDFAYPIRARDGALSFTFGGRLAAVFPFIEGRAPTPSAEFATALGRRIAALHAATTKVADALPERETLAVPFDADLRRELDRFGRIGDSERPGRREMRDLILPVRDEALRLLDRLPSLRDEGAPFVLCHRDIGIHNLIEDRSGRLHFIDWDDVAMAPPEHDLIFGRGPWFAPFIRAYRAAGGTRNLSRDRFAFAYLRRILDDLSFRLVAMAADESGEGDAHALEIVRRWILPEWREREAVLAAIGPGLDAIS